ncbi:MAG: O-methyltransferase [Ginsengibacter sp.]
MDRQLFESVDQYISQLFHNEDNCLEATELSIVESGIPQISVSPNQGKFLEILARLCHAKKILEIGTLGGYSTIWMARALPEDGTMITLEIDSKHAEVAQQNFNRCGLASKIDIRLGKAMDLLPQLEAEGAGPFDMIFIDADKEPYMEYFQLALKLSRPGTLIIADNVIREGKVLLEESPDEMVTGVKRFNEYVSNCPQVIATIFQTVGSKEHDGMAIAIVQ